MACSGSRLRFPPQRGGVVTWILLFLGAGFLLLVLLLPRHLPRGRSKQAECRMNLKHLWAAQKGYFEEKDEFTPVVSATGFSPERGNRYAYFMDLGGPLEDRSGAAVAQRETARGIGVDTFKSSNRPVVGAMVPTQLHGGLRVGVSGVCPDCSFVAVCAGNLDDDATLDVWSVASFDRVAPDGAQIPKGFPLNEVDDAQR